MELLAHEGGYQLLGMRLSDSCSRVQCVPYNDWVGTCIELLYLLDPAFQTTKQFSMTSIIRLLAQSSKGGFACLSKQETSWENDQMARYRPWIYEGGRGSPASYIIL